MIRKGAFVLVALVATLAVVSVLQPRSIALPPGATALVLVTQRPSLLPSWFGCGGALVAPLTIGHEAGAATFTIAATNHRVKMAWPSGWSARLLSDRVELVDERRGVFARDGDLVEGLVGKKDADGTILVCPPSGH